MAFSLPFARQIGRAVSLIFPLVFVAAGIAAIAITYAEGPRGGEFAQFVPYLVGGVFVIIGITVFVKTLRSGKERSRTEKAMEQYTDEPWRVRPEWRTNEIVAEANLSRALIFFAVVWNAISWPAAGFVVYDVTRSGTFEWPMLFVGLFPLVGLGFIVKVLVEWRRSQKFGATVLELDEMPARLGECAAGILKTGVSRDGAPVDGFRIKISCYRQYVRYTRDSDGDRSKRIERDLLWRDEATRPGRAYGDGSRLTVPFTFDLPLDKPPSTPVKSENRILWEVEIDADVPGLDYQDVVEIPVFPPVTDPVDEPLRPSDESADRARDVSASTDASAIPDASGDGAPAAESTVPDATQKMEARDTFSRTTDGMYDDADDFNGPVSDGITLSDAPGQFRLHFSPKRNRGSSLLLGGIGIGMLVGGVFLLGASLLFAVIVIGLGGLLMYGSVQKLMNDTILAIRGGMIEVTHDGVGMPDDVSFPVRELLDVRVSVEGQSGKEASYAIFLHASEEAGLDALKEQAASAENVLNALGVDEQHPARQQLEAAGERVQIRVAGEFDSKEEADWLASKIRQAAQRESVF